MTHVRTVTPPDLDAASALMLRAWDPPTWRYTPAVLAEYLHRPSGDLDLAIGLTEGEHLRGLFAGIPTDVRYRDTIQRAIFTTFLTVEPDTRDVSLALHLYRELMNAARAQGRTHAYTVFFPGKLATRAISTMFKMAGAPMDVLAEVDFMLGPRALVEPRLATDGLDGFAVIGYEPTHRAACSDLLSRMTRSLPLAALIPDADTDYVLGGQPSTTTVLLMRDGEVRGLATGREREIVRAKPQHNVHFDYFYAPDVDPAARDWFLDQAMRAFFARGPVDSITLPMLGDWDRQDFLRRGFLETPRAAALAVAYLTDDAARVEKGLPAFFEVY